VFMFLGGACKPFHPTVGLDRGNQDPLESVLHFTRADSFYLLSSKGSLVLPHIPGSRAVSLGWQEAK